MWIARLPAPRVAEVRSGEHDVRGRRTYEALSLLALCSAFALLALLRCSNELLGQLHEVVQ